MSHYLPVDKIERELQKAVEEFQRASKELKKEEDQLEADLVRSLEEQKIDELKKKLNTVWTKVKIL